MIRIAAYLLHITALTVAVVASLHGVGVPMTLSLRTFAWATLLVISTALLIAALPSRRAVIVVPMENQE